MLTLTEELQLVWHTQDINQIIQLTKEILSDTNPCFIGFNLEECKIIVAYTIPQSDICNFACIISNEITCEQVKYHYREGIANFEFIPIVNREEINNISRRLKIRKLV